jgi:hypothetical protein
MAGTRKENGSGSNAEKNDGRKTVNRKKKRKTSLEMDDVVADLKVSSGCRRCKMESNGDWLLRKPRLTQGCSAEKMDGWMDINVGGKTRK